MQKYRKTIALGSFLTGALLVAPLVTADVFYETSFEEPDFTLGVIEGQDGWLSTSSNHPDSQRQIIQSGQDGAPNAASGDQMARIIMDDGDERIEREFSETPVTETFIVDVKKAFSEGTVHAWSYIQNTQTGFGGAIIGMVDGVLSARDGEDFVPIQVEPGQSNEVAPNEWYRFVATIRPGTQDYDLSVYDASDELIGSLTELAPRPQSGWAGESYQWIRPFVSKWQGWEDDANPNGSAMYMDDLAIIPEPGALGLLGLGSLLLLGRRRRNH